MPEPIYTIVIATANPGKLHEIRQILSDLPVRWLSLDDLPPLPHPVEDGQSFAENAAKKATHYARRSGHWTLAEDSGLEVDSLGGLPGVLSARFAGEPRSDAANNTKLVRELQAQPPERRSARFRCAVALADGTRVLARAEGTIEGEIIDEPRGTGGFGYDPHFFVPELGKTTAELTSEQKNRISHRGQALRRLAPMLRDLLGLEDPHPADQKNRQT